MRRANKVIAIDPLVRYDPQIQDLLSDVITAGGCVKGKKSWRKYKAR